MGIREWQAEDLRQLWRGKRRDEALARPDFVGRAGIRTVQLRPWSRRERRIQHFRHHRDFVNGRACPNGGADRWSQLRRRSGSTILTDSGTGVSLIENVNLRPWEPVAPGVKPYRQHEYVAGVDYQIRQGLGVRSSL